MAFSTPEVVYDELTPAFAKTPEGKGTSFKSSFGPSGEQSRAVEGGLKADVVNFSLAPDVDKLVDAGLVDKNWTKATPHDGFVSTSLVSFIVRKGNPKGIKGWDDLLKPGVKVVTPNPFTSGAAKWNLLGAFQHGGLGFVTKLIKEHVPVQPKSGREALQTFTGGEGDVLISYEYEYTTAVKKGAPTLTSFAAPRGGAADLGAARRSAMKHNDPSTPCSKTPTSSATRRAPAAATTPRSSCGCACWPAPPTSRPRSGGGCASASTSRWRASTTWRSSTATRTA